ncbi:hypothetical protein LTR37_012343 [Vermiconidia calcicola]|uniref:Uncharacterized protein n=1 Tax=Vermiconidia calcicola TaxID=1690605 RepID=A0ACC3MZX7_9PEZI|nr:hypothetical protein LTR37_012343 [Vermiconidia calcicola]
MGETAEQDHAGDILEGLEERLQSHSAAFESLLALIPAREYYGSHFVDGQDPSEQWNRKKQTKEEKRAAKKAKLDPANNRSALDVMKEREAETLKKSNGKRKREEDGQDDDEGGKRVKSDEDADTAEATRRIKADRRKEKRQAKKEKKERKQAKAEAKKARKQDQDLDEAQAERAQSEMDVDESDAEAIPEERLAELNHLDVAGLAETNGTDREDEKEDDAASNMSSAPTTPLIDSPAFDVATNHSVSSSSSSILPPSTAENSTRPRQSKPSANLTLDTDKAPASISKPTTTTTTTTTSPPSGISSPKIHLPEADRAEAQERIRARIEALRAARKADGPARSRQELLDQRRKKTEQKKVTKKAQREKAKEDEQRRLEAKLRGSGSPLGTPSEVFSPKAKEPATSYSFSRLAFEDGTAADASLTALHDPKRKKGPQDPKTALAAAQNKQSRLAGYDEHKRADIAEKDRWLSASKRAHGERVRDDTSLLKKALKRKEKGKNKSEEQWKEREQAVVKGREMKQKKRENNLAKRREEKGGKGGKKGKPSAGGGGKKGGGKKPPKKRAGFEGRGFKA